MVDLALNICVLSQSEAARLENYGVWPKCKGHRHITSSEAQELVNQETYRYLGGADSKTKFISAIAPCVIQIWSTVQCHDLTGKAIMGMKTWGAQPVR